MKESLKNMQIIMTNKFHINLELPSLSGLSLPSISLLHDLRNQNSSERFAKDFRQSYMFIPYMEGVYSR